MDVKFAIQLMVVFAAYCFTGHYGLHLEAVGGFATLVWPPAGIALAAIFLGGYRIWPAVALAAFFINYQTGAPLLIALGIAAGNTLEALVGAALLKKARFDPTFQRIQDVLVLSLYAAVLSTAIAATLGSTLLIASGVVTNHSFIEVCFFWWIGDAIGVLVFAPMILVASSTHWNFNLRKSGEFALLVFGVLFSNLVILGKWGFPSPSFILMPFTLWAALRFSPREVIFSQLLISFCTVWNTIHGQGPFVQETLIRSLLGLQLFMGAYSIAGMILAAAIAGQNKLILALQQVETDLREAVHVRDEFLSIASHELRTPLTSLTFFLQMSKKELGRDEPGVEKLRSILSRCSLQTKRLINLVDGLLDLTRIRLGRMHLHQETTDLKNLLEEIVEKFQPEAKKMGSDLVLADADLNEPGYWDRSRLEQVITNLLSNAIKYGNGKPILVTLKKRERLARISIEDHGIGISEELQTRMFERFERGSNASTVKGLGLGLYISRQIIEAHQGRILVNSKEGEGSTFVLELPMGYSESISLHA